MRCFTGFCILLTLSACAGQIPVVGRNKLGKIVESTVNERAYVWRLTEALDSAQETVLPTLETSPNASKWKLRTVVLGFHVKVSGGIGPFNAGIKPGLRFAFSRGDKPPIP